MAPKVQEPAHVFRICPAEEWSQTQASGHLLGGEFDKQSGFLHLSTADQVAGVLPMFYSGHSELYLLKLDAAKLGEGLKYEPVPDLGLFPHFYGPTGVQAAVPLDAVVEVQKLVLVNGKHVLEV